MKLSFLTWDFALVAAILAILVPWRGTIRVRQLLARQTVPTVERLSIYGSTIAFQWALASFVAWRAYTRGMQGANLGLVPGNLVTTMTAGVLLSAFLAAAQLSGLRALARLPADKRGSLYELTRKLMPQTAVEIFPFIALVCTVSICEEFLYRGFLFSVLKTFFWDSSGAAIAGSAVFFAIGHLYQGRRGIFSTLLMGLVFGATRAWTGSIIPCVVAHFVVDLIAGLGAGSLARSESAASA